MASNTPLLNLIKSEITTQFNEQTASKLSNFLEEGGFDDESIWEDVRDEPESILKDQIPSKQFTCIKRVCVQYHSPKTSKPSPDPHMQKPHVQKPFNINNITNLKRNYTNWDKKTQKTREIFLSQCPGLFNNFSEKSFIDAMTLGRDNKLPLIPYIADTFSRYRINTFFNTKQAISSHTFCKSLPFYKSLESTNSKGTAIHAILSSYHTRFVPKLEFDPKTKISDNIEDIVRYIYAASQMIDSVLQEREQNKISDTEDDIIPFQFDLLIIPKRVSSNASINDEFDAIVTVDSDEDIDSDEEESTSDEAEESHDKHVNNGDKIGYIEPRLRKYDIKAMVFEIEDHLLKKNASAQIKRKLNENFRNIRKGRNGRYVMIVDRRNKEDIVDIIDRNGGKADDSDDIKKKEMDDMKLKIKGSDGKGSNNDKVYMYSPQCVVDDEKVNRGSFGEIDMDYMEESLLYKTKKCCIPGVTEAMDTHLGSDCSDVITLSFHVLSVDIIRCYLYIHGWGTRFEKLDLVKLLPIYFDKKPPLDSNVLNEDKLDVLFPLKLKDEKFEAWYTETTKRNVKDLKKTKKKKKKKLQR